MIRLCYAFLITVVGVILYQELKPHEEAVVKERDWKTYKKVNKSTYKISHACTKLNHMLKIKCLKCGYTSYHPDDVKFKHCPNCKIFHVD